MLWYSVYFEIKHQKWSTRVSLLSTCVCKIWPKSAIGYRNFAKQHKGLFGTPCSCTSCITLRTFSFRFFGLAYCLYNKLNQKKPYLCFNYRQPALLIMRFSSCLIVFILGNNCVYKNKIWWLMMMQPINPIVGWRIRLDSEQKIEFESA